MIQGSIYLQEEEDDLYAHNLKSLPPNAFGDNLAQICPTCAIHDTDPDKTKKAHAFTSTKLEGVIIYVQNKEENERSKIRLEREGKKRKMVSRGFHFCCKKKIQVEL